MKIIIPKQKLVEMVNACERIISKKNTLPALGCILLIADKDLRMYATNLESAIEAHSACDIQEKGQIAVPASVLASIIRSITGDVITMSVIDNNLSIESHSSKTIINAVKHDEFPIITTKNNSTVYSIPKKSIYEGIKSVIYAVSTTMMRPELGSVYVSISESRIVFVATDSFRLAEKTIIDDSIKASLNILIPAKHASEIVYLLDKTIDQKIDLYIEDSQLVVSTVGFTYVSRVVDGQFPDYRVIIPKECLSSVTFLKSEFSEILKKARIFAKIDEYIGLHLYPSNNTFSITARSGDIGEMSDNINSVMLGQDIDMRFSINYLSDCFGSINDDSIKIEFSDSIKPIIIKGVSDNSFMYLVMPVNR